MDEQQLNQIIEQLSALDFVHAKLKLDDFEIELDRATPDQPFQTKHQADNVISVTNPMIGIFHENERPVQIGDQVTPTSVLGQIESMKLFNELPAQASGTVVQVLCHDGQSVEYGARLFDIRVED